MTCCPTEAGRLSCAAFILIHGDHKVTGLRSGDIAGRTQGSEVGDETFEEMFVLHQGNDVDEVDAFDGEVRIKLQSLLVVHISICLPKFTLFRRILQGGA